MKQITKIVLICLNLGILFLALPLDVVNAQDPTGEGIITGKIFMDSDGDGELDSDEIGIPEANLLIDGNGVQITIQTDQNGDFSVQVPWGLWTLTPFSLDAYEIIGSETQDVMLIQADSIEAYVQFGFKAIELVEEPLDEPLDEPTDETVISEEPENNEEVIDDNETNGEVEISEPEDSSESVNTSDLEKETDEKINILPESGALFPHWMIAVVTIPIFLLGLGLVLIGRLLSLKKFK